MKVGIAIVDYGDKQLLENCLKSIDTTIQYYDDYDAIGGKVYQTSTKLHVIVKDNNKDNVGFTLGNNRIIKKYLDNTEFDWIWLLNNDTTVPKETVVSIEKVLPTLDKEIGIIGFKILSMDNPDLIHHAGTARCFPSGEHKSGSVRLHQFNKRTTERWVTGASMLIRREVFESIGLLDAHMINYYSDSDFCFRARYAGFKIIYEPIFVIHHKIGQSQNPSPEQQTQLRKDGLVFQNKWLNGKTFFDLDKEVV